MTSYRGQLLLNEAMSAHTSWRVGGRADKFYKPADLSDLIVYLQSLPPDEPIFFLGLGSNILVRDGGIRGVVIALSGCLNELKIDNDNLLYAQSGVSCARLARFAHKHELSGLEFLSGIPGSVGGALAMNAGAFGSETWQWVSKVLTVNHRGELNERFVEDYTISYRRAMPVRAGEWFVGAYFLLDKTENTVAIKELLKKRNNSQPIGLPSCGSVFKNPPDNYAGKLIENAGLKGHAIGQAAVSDKHANFIINLGGASAADIERLIKHIQLIVKREFAVELTPEVKIIGEVG